MQLLASCNVNAKLVRRSQIALGWVDLEPSAMATTVTVV